MARQNSAARRLELERVVGSCIARAPGPIGAAAIREQLAEQGLAASQATVGRILARLDQTGLTVRQSNKGRVLTNAGREWLDREEQRRAATDWGDRVLKSVGRATLLELRDAMVARRALEREAARLAAWVAPAAELDRLRAILDRHRLAAGAGADTGAHARDFHIALAESCGNSYISGALQMIRHGTKAVEELMYELGVSIGGECYPIHAQMLEAIESRSPDRAQELSDVHLSRYVDHIDRWLAALKKGVS